MWIQTTVEITRERAEKMAMDKWSRENNIFTSSSNEEIEEYIEEQFYNYNIR
jgi:hypothetical protein